MKILKDLKKNTIILILITFLVMFLVLRKDFSNIVDLLLKMDLKFILVAFLLFFISIFLRGYITYKTVNNKEKFSLIEAIRHNVITQFFNGITPFSTGGQPMEIYMLTRHGISANKGTMIILQNFIFYQVALVLFGIMAVSYNYMFHIFPKVVLLRKLVLIGFLVNTLVAIGIFLISLSKKFTTGCMKFIVKVLNKLKIVKNKEQVEENLKERLDEFHESAKVLRKRKFLFIEGVVFNFLSLACLYAIPLLVVYSMHDFTSISLLECLTSSAYVLLVGAFVPIPGASGGIEYSFLAFFGNFLSSSINSAVLLIWRFITYYFGMIIGAIVFNLHERREQK